MMEKGETVNINVLIGERPYPLKVAKADEEKVRNAVQLVNNKIREYQQLYEGKDRQDYLAMCLLNFAAQSVNAQTEVYQNNRLIEEKLEQLEQVLAGPVK